MRVHRDPVYRRRRLTALALAVVGIALFVIAISRDGIDSDRLISSPEVEERLVDPIRFTASFSGDLLIHSPVWLRAQGVGGGEYDFGALLRGVRPFVKRPELAVCHVETPMTDAPPAGFPVFNTPPQLAEAIAETGWDACDTASNHTLDQGQEGVAETIAALERAGVAQTGSSTSRAQQKEILLLDAGGAKVALLAYTSDTNGVPLPKPYSVNLLEVKEVIADARRARERGADVVVVNVHWGIDMTPEYVTEASREQKRVARKLTKAPEITAVVGQGPHIVQQIQRMNGKPVVFSEGNLISNQSAACCAAGAQDGLIALLDFVIDAEGDRVEQVRYVPVFVSQPDYTVLPVGRALKRDQGDPAALRASYERTVEAAGRRDAEPVPAQLP